MQVIIKHSQGKDQFLRVAKSGWQRPKPLMMNLKQWASSTRSSLLEIKSLKLNRPKKAKRKMVSLFVLIITTTNSCPSTLDWPLSWPLSCFADYRDQLMAFGIIPGALDSIAKAFVDLKANLDEEKAARLATQIKVDVLTWTVTDLKISADRFAS
jgi:hypothetical protein